MLATPAALGVNGASFKKWRPNQESAIMTSIDATTRVVIECLPTGAGKTLIYIAEAIMNGGKVVILTSTKGQQNQICASIEPMIEAGIVADVRGQVNYRCDAVMAGGEFEHLNPKQSWTPVADGPCQDGAVCSLKDGGCQYFDAIRRAKKAQIVITNYAFWMTNVKMEPRFQIVDGPVDLLICDEAHETVNEVCDFLSVELTEEDERTIKQELEMNMAGVEDSIEVWRAWAYQVSRGIDNVIETRMSVTGNILDARTRKKLRKVGSKIERMVMMQADNWISDTPFNPEHTRIRSIIKFDPVWPLKYAEEMLFRGAIKVVMSSATVRMKTATLLGLDEGDVTLFESPSTFPVSRRPIYRIPCMQMNYRNEGKEGGENKWIEMVKRIVMSSNRMQHQGLIHTTSYKRRNLLVQSLSGDTMRERVVSHSTSDARTVIEAFRSYSLRSNGMTPRILVSPSITTGYDFADEAARWQIIIKLPFVDTRVKVMKARCKQDEEYGPYHTSTTIQQATGRVVRSEEDWGETFILDDNVTWFVRQHRQLFAQWWLDAYVDWGNTMDWARGKLP
jgi:Rad3-related DNA helicase